ncbi:EGF-like domain-containing protein [Plasmodiophora brassicae]
MANSIWRRSKSNNETSEVRHSAVPDVADPSSRSTVMTSSRFEHLTRGGNNPALKGSFVYRFLVIIILFMITVTAVLLSFLMRSTTANVTLELGGDPVIALGPLAEILQEPNDQLSIEGRSGTKAVVKMPIAGRDRLVSLVGAGDPRLAKIALRSVNDHRVCAIGWRGPQCDQCATEFGFSGAHCNRYETMFSAPDPFALAPPTRACDPKSTAMKCVKTVGYDGVRVVNVPETVGCVVRMDTGAMSATTRTIGHSQGVIVFDQGVVGKSLPFVALYDGYDQAAGQCTGTFQRYEWCVSETPCQNCPTCASGGTCEPALAGDGTCLQCPSGHFGSNCAPCPAACVSGCDEGFAGTGACLCDERTMGDNCDACRPGHFGPTCEPCRCTSKGVCNDGKTGTGTCICAQNFEGPTCAACAAGFTGPNCDACLPDHFGPNCVPCQCGPLGTCQVAPDGTQARCVCKDNVVGERCDQCAKGWYGPTCTGRCQCSRASFCVDGITGTGICTPTGCPPGFANPPGCRSCAVGFTGPRCQSCVTNFFGPSCLPCQCANGGICSDGRAGSGACACPSQFTGPTCSACAKGWYGPSCIGQCHCGPDEVCDDGLSGKGACTKASLPAKLCSPTCQLHGVCDNGVCIGCQAGRFGSECDRECTQTCMQFGTCSTGPTGDGSCSGCAPGRSGAQCELLSGPI